MITIFFYIFNTHLQIDAISPQLYVWQTGPSDRFLNEVESKREMINKIKHSCTERVSPNSNVFVFFFSA